MSEPIQTSPVSGFPEWLPEMRLVEERVIATIVAQYRLYGFTPIETAAVERMEVLTSKGGMGRQIYSLGRPEEGGDDGPAETGLGLHFDLTVPLARYVAHNAGKLVFPFRRYQIQKVWRGERAQKGRFREFYQCDIDVVGRRSLDLIHDAEMPCVINAVFTALAIPEFRIHVSNRKILRDLLSVRGTGGDTDEVAGGEQLANVLRLIDKTPNVGMGKTREALAEEGLDEQLVSAVMDLIQCGGLDEAREIFATAGAPSAGLDELQSVMDSSLALGMPEDRLRPDFAIARGLDYYTGTIYETFVTGQENWGSICSGGRYDDLSSFFSKEQFPGVGLSIGLSRLLDLLVKSQLVKPEGAAPTQVLVTMQDRAAYLPRYLELARTLRAAGIATEVFLEPGKMGAQLKYASAVGVPYAVIAGEAEFNEGQVTIKDLAARSQETMPQDELAAYLAGKLVTEEH